jgi:hypothetical protein
VLHGFAVDVPFAIVGEAIGDKRHAFEAGEQLEEWIARRGDEHFVAGVGVAKELPEIPVRLARACREDEMLGRHGDSRLGVEHTDRSAGASKTEGVGRVGKGARVGERCANLSRGVGEPGCGGVRDGEIEEGGLLRAELLERRRESVRMPFYGRTLGEHSPR